MHEDDNFMKRLNNEPGMYYLIIVNKRVRDSSESKRYDSSKEKLK